MRNVLIIVTVVLNFNTATAGTDATCYADKLPFFKNFARYSSSLTRKVQAIETACGELNSAEMQEGQGTLELLKNRFTGVASFGLVGGAAAAFSSLQKTKEGRQYMATLNSIKNIANPMERIRQTYELAAKHSGHYDHETNGMDTWNSGAIVGAHRPENLLANNRERGTVGVCREFAALLQWSLMQVSRHPTSKSSALDEKDFSSTLVGGTVPGSNGWKDGGGHAWVRINLPVFKNGRLLDFTHFDLDTTWYPKKFAPLFPRRSGVSQANRRKLIQQCGEVVDCLWRI